MAETHEWVNSCLAAAALVVSVAAAFSNHDDAKYAQDTAKQANGIANKALDLSRAMKKEEIMAGYHKARDAYKDKTVSPGVYFTQFWEWQNRQLESWVDDKNQIIPDEEYVGYLNARIDEFRGHGYDDIGQLSLGKRFAYCGEHPTECVPTGVFAEYSSYQKAWETRSQQYRHKKLGKLMDELKSRAQSGKSYHNLDEVRALRESLQDLQL